MKFLWNFKDTDIIRTDKYVKEAQLILFCFFPGSELMSSGGYPHFSALNLIVTTENGESVTCHCS